MILLDETFKGKLSKATYIALGSFDGIHRGHLTLMNKLKDLSVKNNAFSMVYTFKNHPLTVINPVKASRLIMDNEQKIKVLNDFNIDILCLDIFDKGMMLKEPEEFILTLMEKFNARGFVVGFNYRFGNKNKGDLNLLKSMSEKYKFELYVMDSYKEKGEVVSSSRIRKLIEGGEIEMANQLLTREVILTGEVVHGRKLGRTIGFPTANLKVDNKNVIPKKGIYYTNVEVDGIIYKGITNIGNNPTVNGHNTTVETYILDFSEDIYGKKIKLYFIEGIREEIKFPSLEELKKQLEKDKIFAINRNIKIIL